MNGGGGAGGGLMEGEGGHAVGGAGEEWEGLVLQDTPIRRAGVANTSLSAGEGGGGRPSSPAAAKPSTNKPASSGGELLCL